MPPLVVVASLLVCVLATSAPAGAQPVSRRSGAFRIAPLPSRGFVSFNAGYQPSSTDFSDSYTFERNRETARTTASYPIDAGLLFDAGGGVRLWRGLGAGLAVSRFSRDGHITTSSTIPHPLYLAQDRTVAGEADGIRREETAVHLQAQYFLTVSPKLHVTLMGGPSLLRISQAVTIDVSYTEEYPYDTATFAGVDTTRIKANKAGFNVGADARWMVTPRIGVGAMVRFSRATVPLAPSADRTLSVDAGGAQVGAGLRVAF